MSNNKMTPKDFKDFMESQRQEIEKYKWCLGEKLHHDPLLDKSYNEICNEWISNFSSKYRKEWEERINNKESEDNKNIS